MRLVTVDDVGRARQVLDLNNLTGTFRLRDSFRIVNGTVAATFVVRDPSGAGAAAAAAGELERLLNAAARRRQVDPVYVEWRPDGLARSVLLPVTGPAVATVTYNVREWAGARAARVEVAWPTPELAEGLPLDLRDDFRAPPDKPGGAVVTVGAQVAGVTDGDSLSYRWEGTVGNSRAVELVESKLADYTVDAGPAANVRVRDDPGGLGGGLWSSTPASEVRVRHTGRGYAFYDGAVTAGVRLPDPLTATVTSVRAGKIVAGAAGNVIYAWLDVNNAGRSLYLIRQGPPGAAQSILAGPIDPGALAAAGRYWVRLVIHGRFARAEAWATAPSRGGTALAVTAWTDVGDGYGLDGAGEAVYGFIGGTASARLVDVAEEPHTHVNVRTPDSLALRGIPGNALARAEVELGLAAAAVHDFGVIGWRKRHQPHNLASNGDLAADGDNWTNATAVGLNAGGTFTRQGTGGPGNGPYAAITSSATQFSGAGYTVRDRIRRGRWYTVEFMVAGATGASWQVLAELDGNGGNESTVFNSGEVPSGTGWTRMIGRFLAKADARLLEVVFRNGVAAAASINVARLRVYEGNPLEVPAPRSPATVGQAAGALPPFGPIFPLADDASARVNCISVADASGVAGNAVRFTGTTGSVRYLIDPELLPPELLDAGDVDVEVYAFGALATTVVNPRLTASLVTHDGSPRRAYTREFGAAGRPIVEPTANGSWASRLGTLPLTVDGRLRGRVALVIDYTATTSANVDLRHLFLVPVRRRQGSPTGKVLDLYYPTFANAAGGRLKTFDTDGRGLATTAGGAVSRDPGIGGEPLQLEPGTSELALWALTGANPDQPDGLTAAAADATFDSVHVRVTPRYRLVRDA
jgi:hypothetical protein